jgi:hypothetical protein
MKLKLIAAALLALSATAHAHLIQLTPNGFDTGPLNQKQINAIQELFSQTFFDEAAHGRFSLPPANGGNQFLDNWVSLFGSLDGGTYFTTDLFGRDTDTASVSWDMTGEPHGYWMTLIYVVGHDDSGMLWQNIYRVTKDEWFQSGGNLIVKAHDGATINGVAFYGRRFETPEGGATLGLFLLGLTVVIGGWRLFETHYVNDIVRRTKLQ